MIRMLLLERCRREHWGLEIEVFVISPPASVNTSSFCLASHFPFPFRVWYENDGRLYFEAHCIRSLVLPLSFLYFFNNVLIHER